MNKADAAAWQEKTKRLNMGIQLEVGMRVVDVDKHKGVVVKIRSPEDPSDHGTVWVWQEDRVGYGADNCEHYCCTNWSQFLRLGDYVRPLVW